MKRRKRREKEPGEKKKMPVVFHHMAVGVGHGTVLSSGTGPVMADKVKR